MSGYTFLGEVNMKLEKEIKQSKFRNEYHKLTVNLLFTYSWIHSFLAEKLSKYGITPQQFNILRILRGQYPAPSTVSLLKERMLEKISDTSRLVERLRLKGLLERTYNENDRRKVNIVINKKGLELLKEIDKIDPEVDHYLASLSSEEAKTVNDLLDKLRNNKK